MTSSETPPTMVSSGAQPTIASPGPSSTITSAELPERVTINLRGFRYEVSLAVVGDKNPHSLLGTLNEAHPNYDRRKKEFYFDRNPWVFSYIWDYFTLGQAHLPPTVCLGSIRQELEFWGLADDILAPCCWDKLQAAEEEASILSRFRKKWHLTRSPGDRQKGAKADGPSLRGEESGSCLSTLGGATIDWIRQRNRREKLKIFLEDPNSSRAAQVWFVFTVLLTTTSITLVAISTLSFVRRLNEDAEQSMVNITERRTIYFLSHSQPRRYYVSLDFVVLVILTAELALRLAVSRRPKRFFLNVLNMADLLGILPMWITYLLYLVQSTSGTTSSLQKARYIVSCMRVFRVFRVLRLAQTYPAMRTLFLAMRASYKELIFLMVAVSATALIYGHFIFLIEVEEDNIKSIPHGIWWAVVTMTTVGYGDVFPVTVAGKILGILCAMTGILVVALPVPIVANNFSAFYDRMRICQRLGRRHLVFSKPDRGHRGTAWNRRSAAKDNREFSTISGDSSGISRNCTHQSECARQTGDREAVCPVSGQDQSGGTQEVSNF